MTAIERFDEAAEALQSLRDDPSPELAARAAYLLGLGELKQGRNAEALAIFDEAISRFAETSTAPALLFRLAEAADRNGDPTDALARFERLEETYPEDSWVDDALLQGASLALKAGQFDRAIDLARKARGATGDGPLSPASLLIEARAAIDSGSAEQAIPLLNTILNEHQPDTETEQAARYYLGLAYKAEGQGVEAMEQLDALAQMPEASYSADGALPRWARAL